MVDCFNFLKKESVVYEYFTFSFFEYGGLLKKMCQKPQFTIVRF